MGTVVEKNLHVASLDGVRALAASTVFVAHAGAGDFIPGVFGVTVFFFLSGYLITTLLRLEFERTGGISFRKFYLRRIYRIFPPMYIVLTIAALLALAGVFPSEMTAAGVLAQFAHLTNYYILWFDGSHLTPATASMWSLAVEEHFYLIFPLALAFLLKKFSYQQTAAVLLVTCLIVLLWRCFLFFGLGIAHAYIDTATDTRLDSILFGCVLGIWKNPAIHQEDAKAGGIGPIAFLIVSVAVLTFTFLDRNVAFRSTFRYSVQGLALLPVFYCAVRYHDWIIFRWLENKWVRRLGLISYTFYLCHQGILTLVEGISGGNPLLTAAIGFVLTVAFSTAMYLFVERHMSRLRHKLHS
jgi:peptidoglycan/LPS O-acetylase OafA/YrhL